MDKELINSFQQHWKQRGLRSGKLYAWAARRFLGWIRTRQKSLLEVDPALLHEYLLERRSPTRRPTTLKAELDRLRAFFHFAVSRGKMRDNPALGVSHRWLDEPGGLPAYQGVLRRIFRIPRDILRFRLLLFAPHWESYLAHLLARGYSRGVLYHVMEHNADFHAFLLKRGARRLDRSCARFLDDFLDEAKRRFRQTHGRLLTDRYRMHIRNAIAGFLAHAGLMRDRALPQGGRGRTLIPDSLLDEYRDHCRVHRGLSPVTMRGYRRELERFRSFLARRKVKNLRSMSLADLDAFLMRRARTMSPKSLESIAAALRSLLRFLYLVGRIPRDFAASVLSPSRFRADLRPKYLAWERVEELLRAVKGTSVADKRDYAILVLLAGHGLRAREVAALQIEDIDLEEHCIRLRHRKNGATVDLPITERSVRALRDYKAVRREHPTERLFLSIYAPIEPLSGTAVSGVAQRRLRSIPGGRGGAYALRHSFAKSLLDRGARLSEIGSLLGHKSLRSTLIYTRVAVEDMREVADNYAAFL